MDFMQNPMLFWCDAMRCCAVLCCGDERRRDGHEPWRTRTSQVVATHTDSTRLDSDTLKQISAKYIKYIIYIYIYYIICTAKTGKGKTWQWQWQWREAIGDWRLVISAVHITDSYNLDRWINARFLCFLDARLSTRSAASRVIAAPLYCSVLCDKSALCCAVRCRSVLCCAVQCCSKARRRSGSDMTARRGAAQSCRPANRYIVPRRRRLPATTLLYFTDFRNWIWILYSVFVK